MQSSAVHRSILAVDIEAFGADKRTDDIRRRLREEMHGIVGYALGKANLGPGRRKESDTGDGVLHVLDAVHKGVLVDSVASIRARVREFNEDFAGDRAKLRLRVVVHAGEVLFDKHGVTGADLVEAFRLLDSQVLRDRLQRLVDGDVVLMVSDYIYQHVIQERRCDTFTAGDFEPVDVNNKETSTRAWANPVLPAPTPPDTAPPGGPVPHTTPPPHTPPKWKAAAGWLAGAWNAMWEFVRRHGRAVLAGGIGLVLVLVGVWAIRPLVQDCPVPTQLVVAASPSISGTVERLAEDFITDVSERFAEQVAERFIGEQEWSCRAANIRVFSTPSYADAANNIGAEWPENPPTLRLGAEPAVWIAGATAVTRQAERELGEDEMEILEPAIAYSPVVLAVEPALQERLDLGATFATWEEIRGWQQFAKTEAQFVRAAPTSSAAALLSTMELFGLVQGADGRAGLEQWIHPATADERTELDGMGRQAGANPQPPRALFTSEQLMVARNDAVSPQTDGSATGGEALTAIYPRDDDGRTPFLDYPYALLHAAFEHGDRERLARKFHDYLTGSDAQTELKKAGFRGMDETTIYGEPVGVDPTQPDGMRDQPDLAAVNETVTAWRGARPAARVLLAIDVSLSMNQAHQGEQGTRLTAAASDAAERFVEQTSDRDALGLWQFADNLATKDSDTQVEPINIPYLQMDPIVADHSINGTTHFEQIKDHLDNLRPVPRGTKLYETIKAGIVELRRSGGPENVRAMVVVTDGGRGQQPGVGVDEVLAALNDQTKEEVLLFLLGFGPASCDAEELAPMAGLQDVRCLNADEIGLPTAFERISSVMFGSEDDQ